jgi:hypothetical protein
VRVGSQKRAGYHLARERERKSGGRSPFSIEFWLRELRGPEKKTSAHQRQFIISRQTSSETSCRPSRVQRFGQPQFVLREPWRAELWRPSVTPTLAGAFSFSAPPFIIRVPLHRATCAQTKSRAALAAHNAIKKDVSHISRRAAAASLKYHSLTRPRRATEIIKAPFNILK